MSTTYPPDTAPPSYEAATGSASTPTRVSTDGPAEQTARNGIPPERRRSMEDENRPLPPGWIRQFDPVEGHQFFVDTKANPPRSIWVHPYDDPEYLSTLSPQERKLHARMHRSMTLEDLTAESSDDETGDHHPRRKAAAGSSNDPQPTGIHKFTRKMKDKLTGTTHEQRATHRIQREEQERRAYIAHLRARQAMVRALETGQPQFLCKDAQGRDVYIEPPSGPAIPRGAYGYNPYAQGPYADPNARFVRPMGPYGRPYGRGYGGGLGAPVAAGFLGGAVLGGLLF
ncbi:hypothetical protein BU26DRAFT_80862 [Trematosphaeria pertusa]|uniref:WW domain-containing protein n=1 Tax=Trematosphaeria pertusa TaxID=390896 RepID=A0A6A6I3I9_9PLEO|nr:uncharacterized protein BU26DRAFT_80862 [Trematosphaeria pertusa]KAF2244558.1 hypothetical protein BU26DRAFT_80862 [Trematosphaeria pertusa]